MAVHTIDSSLSAGGQAISVDSNVATARAGGGLIFDATAGPDTYSCGFDLQSGFYAVGQVFLEFDTSGIVGDILEATLRVNLNRTGASDSEGTLQARLFDFGASVTTADYRNPTNFSACPLLAHLARSAIADGEMNDFVSDDLAANINQAGMTRLVICTALFAAAGTPTTEHGTNIDMASAELVIETEDAFAGFSRVSRLTYLRR